LFAEGEFDQAAELYMDLAEKAQERMIPQTSNLYLRGADALINTGDLEKGTIMIKKGLGFLAGQKRWIQFLKAGSFTVDRLKSEGQDELATQIQAWVGEQVPDEVKQSDIWQKAERAGGADNRKLPSTCSQCGGPVNPKEVEWHNGSNPICSYCGAVLESNH
jgi:hypothetical protein